MEASVVVCEPLKPPRLYHTENQPKVRKTTTQKRARGARAVRLFPSERKPPRDRKRGWTQGPGHLRTLMSACLRVCTCVYCSVHVEVRLAVLWVHVFDCLIGVRKI